MVAVNPGSPVTLLSQWQQYPGGPATDLTGITITITRVAGGTLVVGPTSAGISHPAVGAYTYTWAVSASQAPGDYLVSWSGLDGEGDTVTATELVAVLGGGVGTFATVRLATTVTGTAGLVDPASITVEVLLPSGEVAGPFTPVRDDVGVYHYDFTPSMAGQHVRRWVTVGPSGLDEEPVDVPPPWGEAGIVSVQDVKDHLKKVTSADDEPLQEFIRAASQMITDRMGQVTPIVVVADRSARRGVVVLPTRPVISITSVERLPGLEAVPQADTATGVRGWTLTSSEGVLSVSGWCGPVRVTYRAGRSPLPPNIRLAALELVAHLWRGSQHNQAGGRPGMGSTDALSAGIRPYAMPFRVMELLGLKKDQELDEPLVG